MKIAGVILPRLVLVLVLGNALVGVSQAGPRFTDLFEAHTFSYTGGQYKQRAFPYRLFVPRDLKAGEKYPLLVWLHSETQSGSDNQRSLFWLHLLLENPDQVQQYRFFILAVQCPKENPTWYRRLGADKRTPEEDNDMLTVLHRILQKTLKEQAVDANRVYLLGIQSGGSGCWEMALRYPELFAAVVPMAAAEADASRAANLTGIPIWAFHNRRCRTTPPDRDLQMVAAIQKAGGTAHLTLEEASGDDCWQAAFRQHHILSWMLSQNRAEPCQNPPGGRSHSPRYLLPGLGIVAMVVALSIWYSKRRNAF